MRARLYAYPPRGRTTDVWATAAPPPVVVSPLPAFGRSFVRASYSTRTRVFNPPLSIAPIVPLSLSGVRALVRRLAVPRGRVDTPISQNTPSPGPNPLVPQFSRTVVRSARGLVARRGEQVTVVPVGKIPPPLPGAPYLTKGVERDRLHWWRDRT
jgi:hypothetical protein